MSEKKTKSLRIILNGNWLIPDSNIPRAGFSFITGIIAGIIAGASSASMYPDRPVVAVVNGLIPIILGTGELVRQLGLKHAKEQDYDNKMDRMQRRYPYLDLSRRRK